MYRYLPLLALLAFISAPLVIGGAEESAGKSEPPKVEVANKADEEKAKDSAPAPAKKKSRECLASEEVVQDLEARESKLKEREEALKEKEGTGSTSLCRERGACQTRGQKVGGSGRKAKELSRREEQVNKMIETLEGMSPKAAAQVVGGWKMILRFWSSGD